MHFYACPYCVPCRKSNLIKAKDPTHEEWDEDEDGDSQEFVQDLFSYECRMCGESFLGTEEFLEGQKRKIKDG